MGSIGEEIYIFSSIFLNSQLEQILVTKDRLIREKQTSLLTPS
jgi:hypothetical protein